MRNLCRRFDDDVRCSQEERKQRERITMIYFVINEIIKTSRRRTWPICGDVVLISSELGIAVHDNRRTLISLIFDSVHLILQTKKRSLNIPLVRIHTMHPRKFSNKKRTRTLNINNIEMSMWSKPY